MGRPEPQRFGKYLLIHQVAVGGMAEIQLAVEKNAHGGHRFVTIKRIRPELACDRDYVEFFLTEGRISLKCAHPNLPQAYEMGTVDGVHYLALEYIHGHTLLDLVRAATFGARPIPVESVLHIGMSVAAALEHLHGLRDVDGSSLAIVHRDVTPQNIMLSVAGAVKLIDFGIVRSAVQTHRTEIGVVKGKFSYMAPEAFAPTHMVDPRVDLFALGVVLHESLTGRSLFRGDSDHDTLKRIRTAEVPDLAGLRDDVPPVLAEVIAHALERNPNRRFQSATDLLVALGQVAETCHIHASMVRLRDDLLARCGAPTIPGLSAYGVPHSHPSPKGGATASAAPPTAPAPHLLESRDPRLAYFLRQANRAKPASGDLDPALTSVFAALENERLHST